MIVSNWSDASFALDTAHHVGQEPQVSDVISLKTFANTEFCPRFINDASDLERIGSHLEGKRVYVISTSSQQHTRSELAMRNLLIARAAKENGAARVVLVEPDLFFSAQDRGPHSTDHPQMTGPESYKKFDGQPASAQLYAQMLRGAGVDQVVAVHNHKPEMLSGIYNDVFGTNGGSPPFVNLDIAYLVAHYILQVARPQGLGENVGLVAPDQGAEEFVRSVRRFTGLREAEVVVLEKQRHGQRNVEMTLPANAHRLKDREVFILDDMVRTGGTIATAASLLHENEETRPRRIYFYCTHTYISPEARENLHAGALTEFATTNTLPNVLNRDDQGRLRQKIVVLKIEAFLADAILHCLEGREDPAERYHPRRLQQAGSYYQLDFSSRNELRGANGGRRENQLRLRL
ncbi:MAG: ribose-phosphate pyrophosphokinase [Gammaproteobacteria bacterium]|nr:ribose-phosphate pyrophosphokinase [Gammaproteobacteria bacterium]